MTDSKVSIIIPIRDEAASAGRALRAVLNQDYQGGLEVLIADGNSTDATRSVVQAACAEYPSVDVWIMQNPGGIVATGLNLALSRSRGDVIVRVDGHTAIGRDYVHRCVEALKKSGADNAGGKMTAVGTNGFGCSVAAATSSPFGIGGGRFHLSDKEEWVDTVYLGAWPRRVFQELGLFDEELVRDQDDEFNYRLREAGGKILLSPQIRSEYTVRGSPVALWRQYFQYGYWKVRVLQKHPRQMQWRQFVPPAFVAGLLGSLAACLIARQTWYIFVGIAGAYIIANLAASLVVAARKGWSYLPLLPLTYAILHLSYGSGFLVGLARFWNRWGDRKGKVPEWKPGEAIRQS